MGWWCWWRSVARFVTCSHKSLHADALTSRSLRPFSMRCHRLRMDGTVLHGRRSTTRPHLGPSRLTTARMIWSSSGDQQLPRHVTGAATSDIRRPERRKVRFALLRILPYLSCRARRQQKRSRFYCFSTVNELKSAGRCAGVVGLWSGWEWGDAWTGHSNRHLPPLAFMFVT